MSYLQRWGQKCQVLISKRIIACMNEFHTPRRIGIYAGTFDPVHTGHVAFALQAIDKSELDVLYFLPERKARYKQGVEHFGHRVAMLRRASQPHPKFEVLELDDVSFTVERTLPTLRNKFSQSQLVFLFGSDAVEQLPTWPLHEQLLKESELVIGVRAADQISSIQLMIGKWKTQPLATTIFNSFAPEVSSNKVREALRTQTHINGALSSVKSYSQRNWLYVSVG